MANIPIFLISDENYAMYMAVTIASICENTNSFVEFYILDGGIHKNTQKELLKLKEIFNDFSIEFIKMDKSKISNFPNLNHFSLNTYLRYFIPEIKPEIKKALYIDTDMVVNIDIQKVLDINLGNKPIGAVPYLFEYDNEKNDKWGKKIKQKLKIDSKNKYFNAGLLLMDCEYLRKNNISEKLIQTTNELSEVLECPDQDVLNVIFENNYKELDYKYNVLVDLTAEMNNEKLRQLIESQDYILHYTGGNNMRPWVNSKCICGDIFWKYAKLTTFYDELKWNLLFKELEKTTNSFNLSANKRKYLFYKLMSLITFGKSKKLYIQKRVEYKRKIIGY